jgi:hypothetical protein
MNKYEIMQAQDNENYRKYFNECRLDKPHSVDPQKLREYCFNIINIFYAHETILRSHSLASTHETYLQDEWHKIFHKCSSSYLLDLAVGIRTLEDILDESCPKLTDEDNESIWGSADGIEHKTLREACNKIIHAKKFSYSLSKLDTDEFPGDMDEDDFEPQPNRCLSGEIELLGEYNKKKWSVTVLVPELIESTLKYLSLCEKVEPLAIS